MALVFMEILYAGRRGLLRACTVPFSLHCNHHPTMILAEAAETAWETKKIPRGKVVNILVPVFAPYFCTTLGPMKVYVKHSWNWPTGCSAAVTALGKET